MHELISRYTIESFIGKKENLEVLEGCLDRTAQTYLELNEQKAQLSFGQPLNPDNLRKILPQVTEETRRFLGITEISPVRFSIFHLPDAIKRSTYVGLGIFGVGSLANISDGSHIGDIEQAALMGFLFGTGTLIYNFKEHLQAAFNPAEKVIRLSAKRSIHVVGEIAHEYTHHIQEQKTGLLKHWNNPVAEGHARGVQRNISQIFAERYNNPAYVFDPISQTAMELKDAYLYICVTNGIIPKASLENLEIPKIRNIFYRFFGHHYSIGVAALCVAEAKRGNNIYQEVLQSSDTEFPIR